MPGVTSAGLDGAVGPEGCSPVILDNAYDYFS